MFVQKVNVMIGLRPRVPATVNNVLRVLMRLKYELSTCP